MESVEWAGKKKGEERDPRGEGTERAISPVVGECAERSTSEPRCDEAGNVADGRKGKEEDELPADTVDREEVLVVQGGFVEGDTSAATRCC